MSNKKYFSLHAHFYQPPRENPWTGEIPIQDSSFPYDNWNNRIFMECYLPNLYGRIKNYKNETLEIVNNYEYLNFNFGPTLLNWLEREYPFYYSKLVDTVIKVKQRKGFSNAIAQGYNHTIIPLDDFSNKILQISCGISDFERRFGFKPEGFWLPETAVNMDTLRILIDKGIKYVILAPYQIRNIKDISTGKPVLKRDSAPCIIYDVSPEGKKIKERSIIIFPYDGELSKKVAFDDITKNSSTFVQTISSFYKENYNKPQLFIIASDGETYGHHHKFADLTLSYTFKYELAKRDIEVVSLSEYLSICPPQFECELDPGPDMDGTSWSCAHGLRRWKGGCNCGDEGKYDTTWRAPLRSAMQWLSVVANDIYKEEGSKIFLDPEKTAIKHCDTLSDMNKIDDFLSLNMKPEIFDKSKAMKLLELKKYSMFIFTSCGWFFNDISRIETRQILKYAARIAQIAEEFGFRGIGRIFASILEMAKSNFKDILNGKKIYEQESLMSCITPEMSAVYLAIRAYLFGGKRKNSRYLIELSQGNFLFKNSHISCKVIDKETFSNTEYTIEIIEDKEENFKFSVINKGSGKSKTFGISAYPQELQKELINLQLCILKMKNISSFENLFFSYGRILEKNPGVMFYNFENVLSELKLLYTQIAKIKLKQFLLEPSIKNLNEIKELIHYAEDVKINAKIELSPDIAGLMPVFCNWIFSNKPEIKTAKEIEEILSKFGLYELRFHIENYLYEVSNYVSQKEYTDSDIIA